MKIIKPDGTIEIRETPNPNRRWSPTEILALEIPPDPLVIGGEKCAAGNRSPNQGKTSQKG